LLVRQTTVQRKHKYGDGQKSNSGRIK